MWKTFDTKISLYSFLPSKTLAWKLIFHAIVWWNYQILRHTRFMCINLFPHHPSTCSLSPFFSCSWVLFLSVSLCVLQCVPSFPSPYFLLHYGELAHMILAHCTQFLDNCCIINGIDLSTECSVNGWDQNLKNYLHLHLRTCLNYSFWKVSPLSHLRKKLSLFL